MASSSVARSTTPLLLDQQLEQSKAQNVAVQSSDCEVHPPQSLKKPVSWASIPMKGQLAVLVFARLAEPLSERSLTSYLFYQLRWLDPSLDDAEIAHQAGNLTAIFAAAQCITSMWWGYAADSPLFGRKRVLLLGLLGTTISTLGMGFSTSISAAFFFRFLAGSLNGNVGVLRTMVSEIVVDKRYRARAFLLLPMCFNTGVIIGPVLSGFLADPINSLPSVFGPGSILGGKNGVGWMISFPYALPNLVSAIILTSAACGIIFGLDETHPQLRHQPDRGRQLGKFLGRKLLGRKEQDYSYEPLQGQLEALDARPLEGTSNEQPEDEQPPSKSIFTKGVCLTLLQSFLQALHVSAFNAVFFVLLPTPRATDSPVHLPFRFSGGLGLSSKKVGLVNTIIGIVGIPVQLFVYPKVNDRLGAFACYCAFLPLSVIAYSLIPYLVLLPTQDIIIWSCLALLLSVHVISRTFVGPATVILVNESAPHPSRLGTIHGIASSTSSIARVLGPTIGGAALAWGLGHNTVGMPLWGMAIVASVNWLIVFYIRSPIGI